MTTLHSLLKAERKKRNLTQKEVAAALGKSYQRIVQIEQGAKPSVELLKKYADLFGLDMSELMTLMVTRRSSEMSKDEIELIEAVRSKDVRRAMRLIERLVYEDPAQN